MRTERPKHRIDGQNKTPKDVAKVKSQSAASVCLWEAMRLPSVSDLVARYSGFPVRVHKE
jgi:hypothetical protein